MTEQEARADREALIALNLATEIYTADDGYPVTRVHSNETAADRVIAAGFRRPSPVTREALIEVIADYQACGSCAGPTWCRACQEEAEAIMSRFFLPEPAEVEWEYAISDGTYGPTTPTSNIVTFQPEFVPGFTVLRRSKAGPWVPVKGTEQ